MPYLVALLVIAASLLASGAVAIAKVNLHKPKKNAVYSNCRRQTKKKRKSVCIPNEYLRTNPQGSGLYALWTTKCSPDTGGYLKPGYPVKIKKNGRFAGTTSYYTVVNGQISNTVAYTITVKGRFTTVRHALVFGHRKTLYIARAKFSVKNVNGCQMSKKFKLFWSGKLNIG